MSVAAPYLTKRPRGARPHLDFGVVKQAIDEGRDRYRVADVSKTDACVALNDLLPRQPIAVGPNHLRNCELVMVSKGMSVGRAVSSSLGRKASSPSASASQFQGQTIWQTSHPHRWRPMALRYSLGIIPGIWVM